MSTVTVKAGNVAEFFKRGREVAKLADAGQLIPPSRFIGFEDPVALAAVMTSRKLKIIRAVRATPGGVSVIAKKVGRQETAVARDIRQLAKVGVLRVRKVKNPGHGVMNFVEPAADEIELRATI
ncbi:MAG: HVO_A0114 family putative DNA-binding protein [Sulfuricella sp.]